MTCGSSGLLGQMEEELAHAMLRELLEKELVAETVVPESALWVGLDL